MAALTAGYVDGSAAREREVLAFLALMGVEGLGIAGVRSLWERHGSGEAALQAIDGRAGLRHARSVLAATKKAGARSVPLGAPEYPAALLDLRDPPPVLHIRGDGWPDPMRMIAVVGTRGASRYGVRVARRLGRDLARWGWTVVSGMAAGIDAAAHAGALDGGGNTIGVLGTGLGHEYPPLNRGLYSRMRERGWLVSEFDHGDGPRPFRFPRRNRIIAALSRAVVIVEAGGRSGALNTATHALNAGREVLVAPSRLGDPTGEGSLRLLRQGAALFTGVRDVFDAIGWIHDREPPEAGGDAREWDVADLPDGWLLRVLGREELTVDEIAAVSGRTVADTRSALGRLEIDGRVESCRGGRFGVRVRTAPAAAPERSPR